MTIASLLGKYWYSDPLLIPAALAIRLVEAPSYPRSDRTRVAASRMRSTVRRDRSWEGILRGESPGEGAMGGSFENATCKRLLIRV